MALPMSQQVGQRPNPPAGRGRNAPLPQARIHRMIPARQSRGLGALPFFGVLGEGVCSA